MKIIVFSRTKIGRNVTVGMNESLGKYVRMLTLCAGRGLGSRGLGQNPEATGMVSGAEEFVIFRFCTSIGNRYK